MILKILWLTICNRKFFVKRSLKGPIRTALKTFFPRYLENGTTFLNTCWTTCEFSFDIETKGGWPFTLWTTGGGGGSSLFSYPNRVRMSLFLWMKTQPRFPDHVSFNLISTFNKSDNRHPRCLHRNFIQLTFSSWWCAWYNCHTMYIYM